MTPLARMCECGKMSLMWTCTDGQWGAKCTCGYGTTATTLEAAHYAKAMPGWTAAHVAELEAVARRERMGLGTGETPPLLLSLITLGLARWDAGSLPVPMRAPGVVLMPAGQLVLSLLPLEKSEPPTDPGHQ